MQSEAYEVEVDSAEKERIQNCQDLGNNAEVKDHHICTLSDYWRNFVTGYANNDFACVDRYLESLLICTSRLILNLKYTQSISSSCKLELEEAIRACGETLSDSPLRQRICKAISNIVQNPWQERSFLGVVNGPASERNEACKTLWNNEGWVMLETRLDYFARIGPRAKKQLCSILNILVEKGHEIFQKNGRSNSSNTNLTFDPYQFSYLKYVQYLEVYAILYSKTNISMTQIIEVWDKQILLDVISSLTMKARNQESARLFPKFMYWKDVGDVAKLLAKEATWKALQTIDGVFLKEFFTKWIEVSSCGENKVEQAELDSIIDEVLKDNEKIASTENIFKIVRTTIQSLGTTSNIPTPKCVELITLGMMKEKQAIESLKDDRQEKADVVDRMLRELSIRYLDLVKIFEGCPKTATDCLITAFSLNPCVELFNLLFPDSKVETEYTVQAEEEDYVLNMIRSYCSDLEGIKFDQFDQTVEEDIGLDASMKDDFCNMIKSPRYGGFLNLKCKEDVRMVCLKLLAKKSVIDIENTELDHLNVDYDMYKDCKPQYDPDDDGIEKGYRVGERLTRRRPLKPRAISRNIIMTGKAKKNAMLRVRKQPGKDPELSNRRKGRPPKPKLTGDQPNSMSMANRILNERERLPNIRLQMNPWGSDPHSSFYHEFYNTCLRPKDRCYKEKNNGRNFQHEALLIDSVKPIVLVSNDKDPGSVEPSEPSGLIVINGVHPHDALLPNGSSNINANHITSTTTLTHPSYEDFSKGFLRNVVLQYNEVHKRLMNEKPNNRTNLATIGTKQVKISKQPRQAIKHEKKVTKRALVPEEEVKPKKPRKETIRKKPRKISEGGSSQITESVSTGLPNPDVKTDNEICDNAETNAVSDEIVDKQEDSSDRTSPNAAEVKSTSSIVVPTPEPPKQFAGAFEILRSYSKADTPEISENESDAVPVEQIRKSTIQAVVLAKESLPKRDVTINMVSNVQSNSECTPTAVAVPRPILESNTGTVKSSGGIPIYKPLKTYASSKRKIVVKSTWDTSATDKLEAYKSDIPISVVATDSLVSSQNLAAKNEDERFPPLTSMNQLAPDVPCGVEISTGMESTHTKTADNQVYSCVDRRESCNGEMNDEVTALKITESTINESTSFPPSAVESATSDPPLVAVSCINEIIGHKDNDTDSHHSSKTNDVTSSSLVESETISSIQDVNNKVSIKDKTVIAKKNIDSTPKRENSDVLSNQKNECSNGHKKNSTELGTIKDQFLQTPQNSIDDSDDQDIIIIEMPSEKNLQNSLKNEKQIQQVETTLTTTNKTSSDSDTQVGTSLKNAAANNSDAGTQNQKPQCTDIKDSVGADISCLGKGNNTQSAKSEKVSLFPSANSPSLARLQSLFAKKPVKNGDPKPKLPNIALNLLRTNTVSACLCTVSKTAEESNEHNDSGSKEVCKLATGEKELQVVDSETKKQTEILNEKADSNSHSEVDGVAVFSTTEEAIGQSELTTQSEGVDFIGKIISTEDYSLSENSKANEEILNDVYSTGTKNLQISTEVASSSHPGTNQNSSSVKAGDVLDGGDKNVCLDVNSAALAAVKVINIVEDTLAETHNLVTVSSSNLNDVMLDGCGTANEEFINAKKGASPVVHFDEASKQTEIVGTDPSQENPSKELRLDTLENEAVSTEAAEIDICRDDKMSGFTLLSQIQSEGEESSAYLECAKDTIYQILDMLDDKENSTTCEQENSTRKFDDASFESRVDDNRGGTDGLEINDTDKLDAIDVTPIPCSDDNRKFDQTCTLENSNNKYSTKDDFDPRQTPVLSAEHDNDTNKNLTELVVDDPQTNSYEEEIDAEMIDLVDEDDVDSVCGETTLERSDVTNPLSIETVEDPDYSDSDTNSKLRREVTSSLLPHCGEPKSEASQPRPVTPVHVLEKFINTELMKKCKHPYEEEDSQVKVSQSVVKHFEAHGGKLRTLISCVVDVERVPLEELEKTARNFNKINFSVIVKRSQRLTTKKMRAVETAKKIFKKDSSSCSSSIKDKSENDTMADTSHSDSDSDVQIIEEISRPSSSNSQLSKDVQPGTTCNKLNEIEPSLNPLSVENEKTGLQLQSTDEKRAGRRQRKRTFFSSSTTIPDQAKSSLCSEIAHPRKKQKLTASNSDSEGGQSNDSLYSGSSTKVDDTNSASFFKENQVLSSLSARADSLDDDNEEVVTLEDEDPLAVDETVRPLDLESRDNKLSEIQLPTTFVPIEDSDDEDYDERVNAINGINYEKEDACDTGPFPTMSDLSPAVSAMDQNDTCSEQLFRDSQELDIVNPDVAQENFDDGDDNDSSHSSDLEIIEEFSSTGISSREQGNISLQCSLSAKSNVEEVTTGSRHSSSSSCCSAQFTTEQSTNSSSLTADENSKIPDKLRDPIEQTQVNYQFALAQLPESDVAPASCSVEQELVVPELDELTVCPSPTRDDIYILPDAALDEQCLNRDVGYLNENIEVTDVVEQSNASEADTRSSVSDGNQFSSSHAVNQLIELGESSQDENSLSEYEGRVLHEETATLETDIAELASVASVTKSLHVSTNDPAESSASPVGTNVVENCNEDGNNSQTTQLIHLISSADDEKIVNECSTSITTEERSIINDNDKGYAETNVNQRESLFCAVETEREDVVPNLPMESRACVTKESTIDQEADSFERMPMNVLEILEIRDQEMCSLRDEGTVQGRVSPTNDPADSSASPVGTNVVENCNEDGDNSQTTQLIHLISSAVDEKIVNECSTNITTEERSKINDNDKGYAETNVNQRESLFSAVETESEDVVPNLPMESRACVTKESTMDQEADSSERMPMNMLEILEIRDQEMCSLRDEGTVKGRVSPKIPELTPETDDYESCWQSDDEPPLLEKEENYCS